MWLYWLAGTRLRQGRDYPPKVGEDGRIRSRFADGFFAVRVLTGTHPVGRALSITGLVQALRV
jgi:hypothetical protein